MSGYWKDHFEQNAELFKESLYKQVGKTVNGVEVTIQQLDCITDSIISSLNLDNRDTVVDLCCGNGLITRKISPSVKKVIGVDFSEGLISIAKNSSYSENISYIVSDVLLLPTAFFKQASKYYMYEALQHFPEKIFEQLLDKLYLADGSKTFFIGSVPDKEKLWHYYDTEEKKLFYLQREKENRPHMGKWWGKDELRLVSEQHGFKVNFFRQNSQLYTSYYRFDCLLEKY